MVNKLSHIYKIFVCNFMLTIECYHFEFMHQTVRTRAMRFSLYLPLQIYCVYGKLESCIHLLLWYIHANSK